MEGSSATNSKEMYNRSNQRYLLHLGFVQVDILSLLVGLNEFLTTQVFQSENHISTSFPVASYIFPVSKIMFAMFPYLSPIYPAELVCCMYLVGLPEAPPPPQKHKYDNIRLTLIATYIFSPFPVFNFFLNLSPSS